MLLKMTRIEMMGERDYFKNCIEILYDMGVVHLIDLNPVIKDQTTSFRPSESSIAEIGDTSIQENLQQKVHHALQIIPKPELVEDVDKQLVEEKSWDNIQTRVTTLIQEIEDIYQQIEEKNKHLTVASKYERILEIFAPILENFETMKDYTLLGLTIDPKYKSAIIPLLNREVGAITSGDFYVITKDTGDMVAIVLLYNRRYEEPISQLLFQNDIREIQMPSDLAGKPFNEALSILLNQQRTLPKEIEELNQKLTDIAKKERKTLEALYLRLEDQLSLSRVMSKMINSDHTFVIRGWVPKKYFKKLQKRLESELPSTLYVKELPIKKGESEDVPVCVSNPKPIRPFEQFMSILPLPKYGAVDPTPVVAIFFPIFFGMMLGDIAYGAIALAGGIYLKWKFRKPVMQDVSYIVIISALMTILFGFLYGELFGTFAEHIGLHPLWMDRMKAMIPLLILTIGIGAFQVLFGIFISIYQSLKERIFKHALGNVGTIFALCGIFFLISHLVHLLPKATFTAGVVLLIVSLPLMIYAEGIISILEVISVIGNILSYARIMAIGISSAIIAMVANKFGGIIGNIIMAAIVVCLMHALNLVLGLFSPTIHSIRLHYVEFFKQFYQFGGKRFEPFARKGGI